jgi:hypothetical protein
LAKPAAAEPKSPGRFPSRARIATLSRWLSIPRIRALPGPRATHGRAT